MNDPGVTYTSYLQLDELLDLQQPRSDEHDELLFIVVHQVYELWFKQLLWELRHAVELLDADEPARAGHTLRRVLTILKVLVAQMDVLETMTPLEFLSFRARLDAASGFQSEQFRALTRVVRDDLWTAVLGHLGRLGHDIGESAVQDSLVAVYRDDPATSELLERCMDLDEGMQEWRYRHVKMVERTIGAKPGTGGSPGVAYLRSTLDRPAYPDLWAIRNRL